VTWEHERVESHERERERETTFVIFIQKCLLEVLVTFKLKVL